MDQTAVMKAFFHQNKRHVLRLTFFAVMLNLIFCCWSGCEKSTSETVVVWGKVHDVTEDLHHRLQAGLFEIGKDPLICEIIDSPRSGNISRLALKKKAGARKIARISWEGGSFWVKSDDHALIVTYLDAEAALSHIQIATSKGFQVTLQFREIIEHPIRQSY